MAYDPTVLSPIAVKSAAWALNTLRMILRDTTSPERFTDDELNAALNLRVFKVENDDGTVSKYYRPHVTAAALIRSDPTRAVSESIDNASERRQEPASIAAGILRDYAPIDDLIFDESGYRPGTPTPGIVF